MAHDLKGHVPRKCDPSRSEEVGLIPMTIKSPWVPLVGAGKDARNGKGCDLGYAPAICSCERAHSVDTCTVAALDVITAFAVPNPNVPSQDLLVFSGLVALRVAPLRGSLSLLRIG